MRCELVVPPQPAGVGIERDDTVAVKIVAEALAAVPVGSGIPGSKVDEIRVGIIRAAVPHAGAACLPGVARPGVMSGLAWPRNRVEAPHLLARLDVEGGNETANAAISARHADDDLVLDDERCVRDRVLVHRPRGLSVPDHPARLRVDRKQVSIDGAHEERIAEDRKSATDAAAARPRLRRRGVLERPEHAASHSVERHDLVPSLDRRALQRVQNPIDGQCRRLEFLERPGLPDPLQLQILHVRWRDLRERAVALVEQRSRVRQPVVRLAIGAEDSLERDLLRPERSGHRDDGERNGQPADYQQHEADE